MKKKINEKMYAFNRATILCELIFLAKVFIDQLKDKTKNCAVCIVSN